MVIGSLPKPDMSVRLRWIAAPVGVLLLVATALRIPMPSLPAYLYFTAVAVLLAVIDIELRRLPNLIVLPSYAVVAALLAGSSLWRGEYWPLARAGLGGVLLIVFFLVLATAQPAGIGLGDVKLAGLIGIALGYLSWTALLVGAFAGILLGGIAALVLAARGRGRDVSLPYGPFLIAGALLGVLL
ncbi:prepilin peptidase [Kutzneria sp. 744]|uniref:prepilin peptidase n=1 Tax=Kutzneria sp. (strain 744) TaxID=345341 RepID=UPI001E42AD88|nr:prepilin peptidase [Kutzneria sp. 744]